MFSLSQYFLLYYLCKLLEFCLYGFSLVSAPFCARNLQKKIEKLAEVCTIDENFAALVVCSL
jgi:hypothetical protein